MALNASYVFGSQKSRYVFLSLLLGIFLNGSNLIIWANLRFICSSSRFLSTLSKSFFRSMTITAYSDQTQHVAIRFSFDMSESSPKADPPFNLLTYSSKLIFVWISSFALTPILILPDLVFQIRLYSMHSFFFKLTIYAMNLYSLLSLMCGY